MLYNYIYISAPFFLLFPSTTTFFLGRHLNFPAEVKDKFLNFIVRSREQLSVARRLLAAAATRSSKNVACPRGDHGHNIQVQHTSVTLVSI